jgi:hypothetical protein
MDDLQSPEVASKWSILPYFRMIRLARKKEMLDEKEPKMSRSPFCCVLLVFLGSDSFCTCLVSMSSSIKHNH